MTAGDRWYDQSIVAYCDRSYEQSWHSVTDRTRTRDILCPSIRSIMSPEDRWYSQSWDATIDCTINRSIVRPIVRSIVATYGRSNNNSWYQIILTSRLHILNITIDLVATDLPLAITHDLCDQSYVLSMICLRFRICWSQLRRNMVVSLVRRGL